jgi:hypothetical protein
MKFFTLNMMMDTFINFDDSLTWYVWNEYSNLYISIYGFMVTTFYIFLHFRIYLMFIYSPYISHYTKYLDLEYSM